jgi:site-specific DNA-adenine methylase
MRPFWNYYGGKYKAALKYPAPMYDTIIEPFGGAAGYALRHPHKKIILIEKNPDVYTVWQYLFSASWKEVMELPIVTSMNDERLKDIPDGARNLIGFNMNTGVSSPAKTLSARHRKNRETKDYESGWSVGHRLRCADQAEEIQSLDWTIIPGDYTLAPDIRACWYIDPPYFNQAGKQYPMHLKPEEYPPLGEWCKKRQGQTMVCENEGATWLPFMPWRTPAPSINSSTKNGKKKVSTPEVIWINYN